MLAMTGIANAQEELSRVNVGELTYVFLGESNEYSLLITPTSKTTPLSKSLTANAFFVKKPSRLVIDIPGFGDGKNKATEISDPRVAGFRVGVHSNKTRLVFDIKNNLIPKYEVTANPKLGAIVVSFVFEKGSAPSITSMMPETQIKKQVKEVAPVKINPAASRPIIQEPLGKKEPELSGETIVFRGNVPKSEPVIPEPILESALITQILFQAPKDAPLGALVIDGKNLEGYLLNQKGPNLYELVLNNASLNGEHLTLPQFPPETFQGFEVVLANQKESSVVIKVYVNDDVRLSPYLSKGKLWLKAN